MFSFRDLKLEDCYLFHKWIKTNCFVKKWWYSNKQPQISTLKKKIQTKLDRINGINKIVLLNGVEIGFIQSYDVDGNGNWTKQVKLYENTASIDFFIGDIDYIHKGYGKLMINEFIETFIKDKYDYVMISPDQENIVSRKTCEKCGFEFVKVVGIPYDNSKNKEVVYIKKCK